MNENRTLGYTVEQIQDQIRTAIAENQRLGSYVSSLMQRLFEVHDQQSVSLRFRVALMLHDTGHYLQLVEDESFCDDPPRSFVRWVTDWLEVRV